MRGLQINFSVANEEDSLKQALAQFQLAYDEFVKVGNLRAMEIVKKNEYKLLKSKQYKQALITTNMQKLELLGHVTDEIQRIRQELLCKQEVSD